MRDQTAMGKLHHAGGPAKHRDALAYRQAGHRLVQGHALDIVHDQIRQPRLRLAAVGQAHNVGVIQFGQDSPLGLEGLCRRTGKVRVDQLDDDDLLEPPIVAFPAPDVTHAAIADALRQPERADTTWRLNHSSGRASGHLGHHRRPCCMRQLKLRDALQDRRRLGLQQAPAKTQIVGTGRKPLEQVKRAQIDFRCGLGH